MGRTKVTANPNKTVHRCRRTGGKWRSTADFYTNRCAPSMAVNVSTKMVGLDKCVKVVTTQPTTVEFLIDGNPNIKEFKITKHSQYERERATFVMTKVGNAGSEGLKLVVTTKGYCDIDFVIGGYCVITMIDIEEDEICPMDQRKRDLHIEDNDEDMDDDTNTINEWSDTSDENDTNNEVKREDGIQQDNKADGGNKQESTKSPILPPFEDDNCSSAD